MLTMFILSWNKTLLLPGTLVHCLVEDSCLGSLRCEANDCQQGSTPNSDRCCQVKQHNRGTDLEPL